MLGSLGEKINHGGTADIHAWAPGQVVKTVQGSFPPPLIQQEAAKCRPTSGRTRPVTAPG